MNPMTIATIMSQFPSMGVQRSPLAGALQQAETPTVRYRLRKTVLQVGYGNVIYRRDTIHFKDQGR